MTQVDAYYMCLGLAFVLLLACIFSALICVSRMRLFMLSRTSIQQQTLRRLRQLAHAQLTEIQEHLAEDRFEAKQPAVDGDGSRIETLKKKLSKTKLKFSELLWEQPLLVSEYNSLSNGRHVVTFEDWFYYDLSFYLDKANRMCFEGGTLFLMLAVGLYTEAHLRFGADDEAVSDTASENFWRIICLFFLMAAVSRLLQRFWPAPKPTKKGLKDSDGGPDDLYSSGCSDLDRALSRAPQFKVGEKVVVLEIDHHDETLDKTIYGRTGVIMGPSIDDTEGRTNIVCGLRHEMDLAVSAADFAHAETLEKEIANLEHRGDLKKIASLKDVIQQLKGKSKEVLSSSSGRQKYEGAKRLRMDINSRINQLAALQEPFISVAWEVKLAPIRSYCSSSPSVTVVVPGRNLQRVNRDRNLQPQHRTIGANIFSKRLSQNKAINVPRMQTISDELFALMDLDGSLELGLHEVLMVIGVEKKRYVQLLPPLEPKLNDAVRSIGTKTSEDYSEHYTGSPESKGRPADKTIKLKISGAHSILRENTILQEAILDLIEQFFRRQHYFARFEAADPARAKRNISKLKTLAAQALDDICEHPSKALDKCILAYNEDNTKLARRSDKEFSERQWNAIMEKVIFERFY